MGVVRYLARLPAAGQALPVDWYEKLSARGSLTGTEQRMQQGRCARTSGNILGGQFTLWQHPKAVAERTKGGDDVRLELGLHIQQHQILVGRQPHR